MKDRFQAPVNGYRDMLINVEMPNGHIVEVQLHLRGVLDVKNGVGHQLCEQTRSIRARAKSENRPLTAEEAAQIQAVERQQKQLYDEAYERSLQPTVSQLKTADSTSQGNQARQQEVITSLRSTHTDHSFTVTADRISINGQIKIHPDKLEQLRIEQAEDFAKLLKGTKALEEKGGDFSKLSKDDQKLLEKLSSSGGQRLRFEYQTQQQVDAYLKEMGLEKEGIFRDMSDEERSRVFDLLNERQPVKNADQRLAKSLEEHQASNYSLSQKPESASEFVEHFQMYKAVLDRIKNERISHYETTAESISKEKYGKNFDALSEPEVKLVQKEATRETFGREVDGDKAIKREAYIDTVKSAGTDDNPEKVNPSTHKAVQDAYQEKVEAFKGRIGSSKIDPNLSSSEIEKQIQLLNQNEEIRFGTESAAAYHVEKHYENEFPQSERTTDGTDVDNYLAGASTTIDNPDRVKNSLDQAGNRSIFYERKIVGDDGKLLKGLAIVKTSPDGEAAMATYHIPGDWKE
jgi:hypothetical protein